MLICMTTIIINLTTFPLNNTDFKAIKRSQFVCSSDKRYNDQPCLKKFVKKEKRVYNAICGVKEKRSNKWVIKN